MDGLNGTDGSCDPLEKRWTLDIGALGVPSVLIPRGDGDRIPSFVGGKSA